MSLNACWRLRARGEDLRSGKVRRTSSAVRTEASTSSIARTKKIFASSACAARAIRAGRHRRNTPCCEAAHEIDLGGVCLQHREGDAPRAQHARTICQSARSRDNDRSRLVDRVERPLWRALQFGRERIVQRQQQRLKAMDQSHRETSSCAVCGSSTAFWAARPNRHKGELAAAGARKRSRRPTSGACPNKRPIA